MNSPLLHGLVIQFIFILLLEIYIFSPIKVSKDEMMEVHSAIMLDTSGQPNHQPFLKKVGKFVSSICKTTKPKYLMRSQVIKLKDSIFFF